MITDFIPTYTGRRFDLDKIIPGMIDIRDIAHSLSMTARFNGHPDKLYSVAQHSVLVSRIGDEYLLPKLLHDAPEAYTGDLVLPMKAMCPDFRLIESRIELAIAREFHLAYNVAEIKRADDLVCVAEKRDLFANGGGWPGELPESPHEKITPWLPSVAEEAFLCRFHELTD